MLITLLGPDRYSVSKALKQHLDKYASQAEGLADLNLTRLDGARVSPDELVRAAQSVGFFSENRVVVVEGLLSRFGSNKQVGEQEERSQDSEVHAGGARSDAGGSRGFADLLGSIPDSTILILVERSGVAKNNALFKVAARFGKVEEYILPRGTALERWISKRGAELGVRVTPGAQAALAGALPTLQALDNELQKLALYVGNGGTIDERVLKEMSFAARQDDVFDMTSAVARRDTRGALLQLQRLRDGGTAPEGILPVLAWQIKTLIQVRDMIDRKVPEAYMAEKAGMSDFVARKTVNQAREFSMPKLLEIHRKVLELDHAVKTGRAEAELSIDALVVEMCR